MNRLAPLVLLLGACSGVSQADYDDLQSRFDATRDAVAVVEVERAELTASETAVAAYVAANDPLDVDSLEKVYSPDLVFFDAARGRTFRSRDAALADLRSGIAAYRIERVVVRASTVEPGKAALEWETRGITGIGTDWSFRGVSLLVIEDGLVVSETMYYDSEDAPWG